MNKIISKIKQSVEWEVICGMTRPKIILYAILFDVLAFEFMNMALNLYLFYKYEY